MNKNTPKVSVIVPVYNAEEFLEQCLESIVNQTLRDIEIILINDGSTDNSAKICEEYAKKDSRIIFETISTSNCGPSIAKNKGLGFAKGEFIGFIDSDDWIDLDFYEKLYNAAIETSSQIAVTNIIRKREYHQKYRIHYEKQEVFESVQEKINSCNIPEMCYMWNKIYHRETFKKNGLLFEENVFYEDVRLLIKVIYSLGRLVTVPDANYYYRVNKKSIVKSCPGAKKLKDHYEALLELLSFADGHNIKIDEKVRSITKDKKYFLNILWLKIKRRYSSEIFYLFGFIPFLTITKYNAAGGEN